jgi:diacylglycerol kinase (ATP)
VRNFVKPTDKRVQGAARGVARFVERHPARYHVVRASGEDLSGEYLAVEAMNIREIGPRLQLAPHADPGDGLLDLVLVPAERRAELVDYLASLGAPGTFPPVITRRVTSVELSWSTADGHVDDSAWPRPRDDPRVRDDPLVRIEVQRAVTVLALPG